MELIETNLIDLADVPHRPQKGSKASSEANRLGLTYLGFGRYGLKNKDGKIHVTHHVKKDQLYPVTDMDYTSEGPKGKMINPPKEFNSWKEKYGAKYKENVEKAPKTANQLAYDKDSDIITSTEDLVGSISEKVKKQHQEIYNHNYQKYKKELAKDLSSKQSKKILMNFIQNTDDINQHLYRSPDPDRFKHRKTAWKIRKLDSMFNKEEYKTDFDYSVYTGTRSNLEKGKTFTFKGFLSTSLSPKVAAGFMVKKGNTQKSMIQIDVKKGQKILDLEAAMKVSHGADMNSSIVDLLETEKEHVLPRNSFLKIVDGPLHMEDGVYFRAEIVSDNENEYEDK